MTLHLARSFVMRERDGAILALEGFATRATEHERRVAAAIEQDHHLLAAVQPLFNFLGQLARDHLLMTGFLEFLPHVDEFDFRQWPLLHSIRQLD